MRLSGCLILTFSLATSIASAKCEFKNAPTILQQDGKTIDMLFAEKMSPEFWQASDLGTPALNSYRNWASLHTNVDQIFLLKRERAIFAKIPEPKDVMLFDQIIEGKIGTLTLSACIEDLLFERHLQNVGRSETLAEFGGAILEKESTQEMKAYFITTAEEDIGVGVSDIILHSIEKDKENGFVFRTFIHNHTFVFDNEDIGGANIGSTPDYEAAADYEKRFQLQSERITNGFHTLQYSMNDVHKALAILRP